MRAAEIAEKLVLNGCHLRAMDIELMILRHLADGVDAVAAKKDKIESERDRYKAALEKIENIDPDSVMADLWEAKRIARAALKDES